MLLVCIVNDSLKTQYLSILKPKSAKFYLCDLILESVTRVGYLIRTCTNKCTDKQAGVAEWIACLLVDLAAQDRISLLPKVSIHHCLPSTACMMGVWKVGLLYTHLYSVHPYWQKRQVQHQT